MSMKLTYRSGTGTSRYWENESSIGSIVDGKDARVNELKFNTSNSRWEMTNNDGEVLAYNSDLKLDGWTGSYSYNLRFPAEYTPPESGRGIIGWRITDIDRTILNKDDFEIQGMYDNIVGDYLFDQPLVEEETTEYTYSCGGTKTYWFEIGGSLSEQDNGSSRTANYRFLYVDFGNGYWLIGLFGPANSRYL